MNVNLRGTFFCCRAAFKHMKAHGGGIIINMSSVAGVQAWAGTGTYSASKHGVMALTRAWRMKDGRSISRCPLSVPEEWPTNWSMRLRRKY